MPKTWFTADTHFGHHNVIRYCGRPFLDANSMDERLIENWNAVVKRGDKVWHVGDFAMGGETCVERYLDRLQGSIHLVHGNHDRPAVKAMEHWASSSPFVVTRVEGQHLVLCHYAMRTWPGVRHGALHLYGHSHGGLPGIPGRSCDVGVDCWDFRPVALEEIRERIGQPDPVACRAA